MNWMSNAPGIQATRSVKLKAQLDEHLDGLVQQQYSQGDAGNVSWTSICAQRLSCWFLASMDIVACGTNLRRSLAINFPVTRQTP